MQQQSVDAEVFPEENFQVFGAMGGAGLRSRPGAAPPGLLISEVISKFLRKSCRWLSPS